MKYQLLFLLFCSLFGISSMYGMETPSKKDFFPRLIQYIDYGQGNGVVHTVSIKDHANQTIGTRQVLRLPNVTPEKERKLSPVITALQNRFANSYIENNVLFLPRENDRSDQAVQIYEVDGLVKKFRKLEKINWGTDQSDLPEGAPVVLEGGIKSALLGEERTSLVLVLQAQVREDLLKLVP